MKNTYLTADEASQDKMLLAELLDVLDASPSTLRRDEGGLWILRGRPGCYASTWGDDKSWQLVVAPDDIISKRQWTLFKRRLSFVELTQDGDQEGCFRLHRLPTAPEAEVIRDILGIRKRIELSPQERTRRQELARRLNDREGPSKLGPGAGTAG